MASLVFERRRNIVDRRRKFGGRYAAEGTIVVDGSERKRLTGHSSVLCCDMDSIPSSDFN